MNPTEAREYLRTAAQTETGRDALLALGYEAVIAAPEKGDDASTVRVAEALRAEIARRYGL